MVETQLLDPVSVLLHLSTLPLEKNSPKIGIKDHHLIIQTKNHFQSVLRQYHGHTREEVSRLFDAIVQTYYWFFTGDPSLSDPYQEMGQTSEFRDLVRYAIAGLRILQQTYQTGNTVLALQLYINMYQAMLNGDFNPTHLPEEMFRTWKQRSTLVKEEERKKLWTLETLKQLQQILKDCFHTNTQEDLGEDDRQALLKSKLQSVRKVLDRHDGEFFTLIKRATS